MIAGYRDQETDTPKGIWSSLNRILVTLMVLMGVMIVLYRYVPETAKRIEQAARVAALQEDIEKEQQQNARLTREADLLTRDPEYVGLLARDRLDLVGPGEKVYRLDQPAPAAAKSRK